MSGNDEQHDEQDAVVATTPSDQWSELGDDDLGRFFRDSPVLACTASLDGYLTELGGPWTETLGWSASELTSRPFAEFVHPDDRTRTAMELERLNAGLPTVGFVNRYRTRDGGWRHIQWHSRRGPQGEILAIAWDATDQMAAAQLLDQRTVILETLNRFQNAAIASDLHDLPLDVLVDGLRRAAGCAEVLIGTVTADRGQAVEIGVLAATDGFRVATEPVGAGPTTDTLVGPTEVARITNLNTITAAAVRTGTTVISDSALDDPRSTGDAGQEPAVGNVLALPLHGASGLVGTIVLADRAGGFDHGVVDLLQPLCASTAALLTLLASRRQSERASQLMARLSTLFTAVVHDLDAVLIVTGLDGTVRLMNPAAERLLGATTEAVAGRCGISDFVRPTDGEAADTYDDWVARPQRDRREWMFIAAGGVGVPVLMSVSALRDERGTLEGWVHLGTDLTERKQIEQQRSRSAVLEDQVDTLRARERELGLLREATEYVMAAPSTRDALAVIGAFAPKILVGGGTSVSPAATGDGRPGERPHRDAVTAPVEALTCWALRTGRTHVSLAGHATRCQHLDGDGSYVCTPLGDGERTLAVITAGTDPDESAVRRTASRTEDVARQMGVALANLGLRRSLERQAVADPLTGVGNRRAATTALDEAHHACRQRQEPFALVMVDLDHFKEVNDRLGHDVGDRVLREVAHALTRSVREGDVVARMGGEEFLVVLRNISPAAAARVAESLRIRIEGSVAVGQGRCTASAGLVHVSDADADPDQLVARADSALYDAKRAGRNRVVEVPEHGPVADLSDQPTSDPDLAGSSQGTTVIR